MKTATQNLNPNIGVEIEGLHVPDVFESESADFLRSSLQNRFVVLPREQNLEPQQQVTYARIYGEPELLKSFGGVNIGSSEAELPAEVLVANNPCSSRPKTLKGSARPCTMQLNTPDPISTSCTG